MSSEGPATFIPLIFIVLYLAGAGTLIYIAYLVIRALRKYLRS
jgi:threonine/homoserine/homoserine lactone efflux protein